MSTELIPRAEWGYTGRLGTRLSLPVSHVFIHHTVTRRSRDHVADALTVARIGLDRFGMLSYSMLLHDDGSTARGLEGQGDRKGAHTKGWNSKAVAFCAIGDYENRSEPSDHLLQGFVDLIRQYIRLGIVAPSPSIRSHHEVSATACCGGSLRVRVPEIYNAVRSGSADIVLDPVLHGRGSEGQYVALLQGWLVALGYDLGPHGADGDYGADTSRAVAAFQKDNGLTATGVYRQSSADKLRQVVKDRGLVIPAPEKNPTTPEAPAVDLDAMGNWLADQLGTWAAAPERPLPAELAVRMDEFLSSGDGRI